MSNMVYLNSFCTSLSVFTDICMLFFVFCFLSYIYKVLFSLFYTIFSRWVIIFVPNCISHDGVTVLLWVLIVRLPWFLILGHCCVPGGSRTLACGCMDTQGPSVFDLRPALSHAPAAFIIRPSTSAATMPALVMGLVPLIPSIILTFRCWARWDL